MTAFEFLWEYLPTIMAIMALIWVVKGISILMKGGRQVGEKFGRGFR